MASEFVQKVIDTYNSHDTGRFDALLTEDCVLVRNDARAVGREACKEVLARLYAAFPDILYGIEDVIESGEKVALRWQGAATHRGEYLGVPATGRSVRYGGITLFERKGERISRIWVSADMLDLMRKLSAGPSPRPEARV